MRALFPDAASMYADAPRGEEFALKAMGKVVAEIYNKAQIDVLIRLNV
jgi:hypothetical protein